MEHLILRCAPLNDVLDDSELGKPLLTEDSSAYGWITAAGETLLLKRASQTFYITSGFPFLLLLQKLLFHVLQVWQI